MLKSDPKRFYITTPIYFPSGKWHIGTCYTTIVCDAIARFKKMDGFEVFYLTGTDEHGQKIEKVAKDKNLKIMDFLDEQASSLKKLWELLGVGYDKFIRTTDDYHVKAVQRIFSKLYEKGDIYKAKYEGHYCTPCESFWASSQLIDGKCPDCGRTTELAEEESYFFRLSKYTNQIIDLIESNPSFLNPKSRQNEMLNNFLRPGLQDLCVSRSTCKWGIKLPFDEKHVAYVWIDALVNYISALGYGSDDDSLFKKFWPADLHMMGKEIVRFHSIIWPALLMALDIPIPKRVYGHGWLLFGEDKMSKSKNNIIDPIELCSRYTVDAVRYYLLREVPFGNDGAYTNRAFLLRRNADLCNGLGNLLSRTTAMIDKYFSGVLPSPLVDSELDLGLKETANNMLKHIRCHMDALSVPDALGEIWTLIDASNKYIDETKPWVLAKNNSDMPRLGTVLYNLAESLRIIATFLSPFLIDTPNKIFDCFSLECPKLFDGVTAFGLLKPGTVVKISDKLFDRLDVEKELSTIDAQNASLGCHDIAKTDVSANENAFPIIKSQIDHNDFSKLDLRVGIIKTAEHVKKSEKLLKFTVDIGIEERTIVSGIAKYYDPSALIGKSVTVVCNLAPVKLCGILSNGMLLCAEDSSGDVVLISPHKDLQAGSVVS
ncbi:MAG: methionine--tRNA ligase [Christensenellaceae bacterium]|nr:methionine--tRNA ligase [Christensenellaceae bacterium]